MLFCLVFLFSLLLQSISSCSQSPVPVDDTSDKRDSSSESEEITISEAIRPAVPGKLFRFPKAPDLIDQEQLSIVLKQTLEQCGGSCHVDTIVYYVQLVCLLWLHSAYLFNRNGLILRKVMVSLTPSLKLRKLLLTT